MKALILAGGFGTRIKHLFPDLPKPMIPIHGVPFLKILLDSIINQGVTHIYMAVYHQKDVIMDYFKDVYNGVPIVYIVENEPLGTGGAIQNAIQTINDRFFVFNGDTICDIDLREMYRMTHRLIIGLATVENTERYGRVLCDENYIVDFQEKGITGFGFINAGVYLMEPEIFLPFDLPQQFSFEADFMKKYIDQIRPKFYQTNGYFIDIGIPEDYYKFCDKQKELTDK